MEELAGITHATKHHPHLFPVYFAKSAVRLVFSHYSTFILHSLFLSVKNQEAKLHYPSSAITCSWVKRPRTEETMCCLELQNQAQHKVVRNAALACSSHWTLWSSPQKCNYFTKAGALNWVLCSTSVSFSELWSDWFAELFQYLKAQLRIVFQRSDLPPFKSMAWFTQPFSSRHSLNLAVSD